MTDSFGDTIELRNPVLRDEQGAELAEFTSASILSWKSGRKELQTEPPFLPDAFDFHRYGSPGAPPLYLESERHRYRVVVSGANLLLA
jgi:hypothetical protein